jgi:hypothetical protein
MMGWSLAFWSAVSCNSSSTERGCAAEDGVPAELPELLVAEPLVAAPWDALGAELCEVPVCASLEP